MKEIAIAANRRPDLGKGAARQIRMAGMIPCVMYGPEIMSKGFVFFTESGHLLEDAKCVILEIVEETGVETPNRVDIIREKLKTALRQYFTFTIKRRPMILPFIMEV